MVASMRRVVSKITSERILRCSSVWARRKLSGTIPPETSLTYCLCYPRIKTTGLIFVFVPNPRSNSGHPTNFP